MVRPEGRLTFTFIDEVHRLIDLISSVRVMLFTPFS